MAGYHNFSMSNNAVNAYNSGEMPCSKWTKSDILGELPKNLLEQASKLTLQELKNLLLYKSSWHHTSNHYNCTDFYSIDTDVLEDLTIDTINNIINNRVKRERKAKTIEEKPLFVTAYICYDEWTGTRKRPKKTVNYEVVHFMSTAKMVDVSDSQNYQKRMSSINIIHKIEQKTKFATVAQLRKKYKIN